MIYFLLLVVFVWLTFLTVSLFRREKPNVETWTTYVETPTSTEKTRTKTDGAVFVHEDRIHEILKEKKDALIDDILV